MSKHITKGNVFGDLGFSDTEAAVLAMRVDISIEIEKYIKRNKMTQAKAAEYFGVPQPKISRIQNGQLEGFTIDYLVKMASKTGKTPRVAFGSRRRSSRQKERQAAA